MPTCPTPKSLLCRVLTGLMILGMGEAVLKAATPKEFKPLYINCGGGDITDRKNGIIWQADKPFIVKGRKYSFGAKLKTEQVEGAPPVEVYRSVRRANVTYKFPKLGNGIYKLRMHFVDGKQLAQRSMDFWVEGAHLIQNLSVREAAGGVNRAYVFEAIVEVRDGNGLEIRGTRGHGDDVFISALEILPAPQGSVVTRPVDSSPNAPATLARDLRAFAGGPVRLVWTRTDMEEDFYLAGPHGTLMGYDTEDGKGERVILPTTASYALPILSPDGQSVVFTDQEKRKCFVVGFNGSGLREIAPGYASDVWQDPKTGRVWVYVRTGWRTPKATIERYDLKDPSKHEVVWTQSAIGQPQISYFQLSGDGRLAADGFPWPQCGLANLAAGDFSIMAKGCWPSVAPDESHRSFIFTGQHTSIQFFDEPSAEARLVNLATVPGWIGRKLYHPRWTNDVRYITATAPQWMPETELYLGKFDERFGRIEGWFRITYNETSDFFGDAWFSNARPPASDNAPAIPTPMVVGVSGHQELGLVFVWENERAKNAILDAQGHVLRRWTARYEGETRPNRWFGADIRRGTLRPDEEAADAIAAAMERTQAFTMSLDISQYVEWAGDTAVIAYLGSEDGKSHLMLEQGKSGFRVRMELTPGQETVLPMGDSAPTEARQLVLTYADHKLTGFSNGREVSSLEVKQDWGKWKPAVLLFGNTPDGTAPWSGAVENARVYDQALPLAKVQEMHRESAAAWEKRTSAARTVVEAELLQASEPDDPETIAPYVRSLGENVYRVKRVISGELAEKEIVVLQWVILGGKILPSAEREEGKVYQLTLEAADAHPQLSGEHRSTDIFEPEMGVFYDVDG